MYRPPAPLRTRWQRATKRGAMPQVVLSSLCCWLLAAAAMAQSAELPRRVAGTVHDEAGQPIAGALVRLEVCLRTWLFGVLATELQHDPLPVGVSAADGSWSLILAASHDAFDAGVHGRLALVVEADGRQPWREMLPDPPRLYDGSDVVLPRLADLDLATIRVDRVPGALVLLRRFADDVLGEGGPPPGESQLLEVPADGVLRVSVPVWPNPPCVPATGMFAVTGWTAQLLQPGASSPALAIVPGQSLTLAAAAPATAIPAVDGEGARRRVGRCLRRLPDDTLRWFAAADGNVAEDPLLPVVAVELAEAPHQGFVVAWPGPLAIPDVACRSLRFADQDGGVAHDVLVSLYRPDELAWTRLDEPRPVGPAQRQLGAANGELVLPKDLGERTAAWVTAPGLAPRFVLDVRALAGDGRIALHRPENRLTVEVRSVDGEPIAGARVFVGQAIQRASSVFQDGVWSTAAGSLPVTDAAGRCELANDADWPLAHCAAVGWRFGSPEFDAGTRTLRMTGNPVHLFAAREVDEHGLAMPFANLGYEVWVRSRDGSSMGTQHAAMADSRGTVRMFGDPGKPPKVRGGELGSYPATGRTALSREGPTDVVVSRDPLLAVIVPACEAGYCRYAMAWHGVGRGINGSIRMPTKDGYALLLRWPAALPLLALGWEGGPPIVVARDEANEAPRHVIDRRGIVRHTPLSLAGDVPADLQTLLAVPAAVAGLRPTFAPLGGDYLGNDRNAASLTLETRDLQEHRVWLMHPDLTPTAAVLPAGDASAQVAVVVHAGAPCTLRVTLQRPLDPRQRAFFVMRKKGRFGGDVYSAPLCSARLSTPEALDGVDLRAPFALPNGTWTLSLDVDGELAASEITVGDGAPVQVELKALR